MKKPTRQRLVGRDCEDSEDADQLGSHPHGIPTRLLDCQRGDRATTTAECAAMKHEELIPFTEIPGAILELQLF